MIETEKSQKSKQKRNKTKMVPSKQGFLPPFFKFIIFAYTTFFRFPNQFSKSKALGQPQRAGKECPLTHNIA